MPRRKSTPSVATTPDAAPSSLSSPPSQSRFLLSIPDLQRELLVSRAQIFRILASGELGVIRVGRRPLMPISELERFIAARLERQTDA